MNEDLEHLLIASETSDPFGVLVIDPKSGVSKWSYKGSELQGAVIGHVERVGANGDLLLVSSRDKPLLHALSVSNRRRFHIKSVLQKAAEQLVATADGTLLFASIDTQIFVWMVSTGELINVFNAHYRRVTRLALNSDGTLLFSGAEDGSLNAFLVADILSLDDCSGIERIAAFAEWRPHSLAVSDLVVTLLSNCRVISCSKDHTAAIYSLTMRECLLKISGDVAISACAVDPAECRLFLGAVKGAIVQIDLYSYCKSDLSVVFGAESDNSLPMFTGHSAEIRRLAVNLDGSLLASGDAIGNYTIWDILSRQCLKTASTRGAICKLEFVLSWIGVHEEDASTKWQPPCTAVLKRQKGDRKSMRIPFQPCTASGGFDSDDCCVAHLDGMIRDCISRNLTQTTSNSYTSPTKTSRKRRRRSERVNAAAATTPPPSPPAAIDVEENESTLAETVKMLRAKVAHLTATNREIYEFAASLITADRS